ncbi:MAG: hypothetical protein R3300_14080 [Candidatus Promineifilaceae bacterium]|nr:hypothetical protein [Candidatus Promineifilaceae bacterium]
MESVTAAADDPATPSPSPSPTPSATFTPTLTPQPTATPTLVALRPLPNGWQLFGNERFGFQIAAPQSWADLSHRLRPPAQPTRFGPRLLLLVDSVESGARLLAGAPVDQGAYAFGYAQSLAQTREPSFGFGRAPDPGPADALQALLAETSGSEVGGNEIGETTIAGFPAAFIDVPGDALGFLPPSAQTLRQRLVVIQVAERSEQLVVAMGTLADDWEDYEKLFTTMMDAFRLTATNATVQGQIQSGDIVTGTLSQDALDVWTFNGLDGRYANIALSPKDAIDPTLTLIGPQGRVLSNVDNGLLGDAEALTDILLTADGTYLIEAGEFFNETGEYELTLLLADAPQFGGGGRVEFGSELSSELIENGEHTWVFDGSAGQEVSIIVNALDEQLDVIMALRGPDGRILEEKDEGFSGDAELMVGFELPVTGEYAVLVRGFAGHGGRYSLSLDEGGESTENFYEAGDLEVGQVQREYLRQDEVHAWFLDGRSDDQITIEVRPLEPSLDMDIWLVDPAVREQLVRQDEFLSGEPEVIEYTLPLNGQYVVLVREFFGEPGEYEIGLRVSSAEDLEITGRIQPGEPVQGELIAGQQDGWTFAARRGDLIDVTLDPLGSPADLELLLVDPSGEVALNVDLRLGGLTESLVGYEITQNGIWTVVVQEFFNEGSPYELTVSRQESAD